jgi:Transposase
MVADDVAFVIGVDTHAHTHTLALVEARTQRTSRGLTVAASRRGYRQALRLARRHAPGARVWALEGSGSYGAGLARFLGARGERVLEVERPRREGARGRFKSDTLDAERAARKVVAGSAGVLPRVAQDTQALRALLSTREGAVTACTAALNELRALIVTAPPELRERLQGLSEARLIGACVRLRPGRGDSERAPWRSRFARSRCACASSVPNRRRSRQSSPAGCRRSPPSSSHAAGSARSPQRPCSSPGLRPAAYARRRPSPVSPGRHPSPPARARSCATGSTAAAIAA